MFKKILVAVDGSTPSRRAVGFGADLAAKYGAALHLVHAPQIAAETLSLGSGSYEVLPTEKTLVKLGEPVIEKAKTWAREAGHAADAVEMLIGDTAQSILDYADRNGIDLIISGSRGLGGLRGLLQGSVSQKLTAHADCPVLTVR